ncbi:Phosphatidylinositol 4-kinase alpha [Dirofilaria immitis]
MLRRQECHRHSSQEQSAGLNQDLFQLSHLHRSFSLKWCYADRKAAACSCDLHYILKRLFELRSEFLAISQVAYGSEYPRFVMSRCFVRRMFVDEVCGIGVVVS